MNGNMRISDHRFPLAPVHLPRRSENNPSTSLFKKHLVHFLFILLTSSSVIAQEPSAPSDTLVTVSPDTTRRPVSGVDTVVVYSAADSIVYSLTTRTMTLYSKGDIRYKQMRLKAEEIDINWDSAMMNARGVQDTAATDTMRDEAGGSNAGSDTSVGRYVRRPDGSRVRYRGTPVMVDGGEEYRGFALSYNFRTQRGKIDMGDTEVDRGYYHGEAIKKVDKDVLFVEDGRYTTCDADEPHYYFFSPKMKVVMQDKVVAEPVYLYIADVPVFALPFGVFPNKSGRRSGIIAPAYGEDGRRGRYLSHFGYYWAISDYMDWNIRGDAYSKGGWAAYSDFRYALRYNFSGGLSGDYKKLHTGESGDPDRTQENSYRVNIRHNQEIDPTTRMDVNFTFASNNSYRTTNNLQQALDQAIFSNATLSKFWEGTPNSMSLNVSRSQNLQSGNITETLPALSFNRSQSFPFRPSRKGGGDVAWYELIGYSYSANATNNRAKTKRQVAGVKTPSGLQTVEVFQRDNQQNIAQSISVNASPKLGYFTVTPSVSFQDNRTFVRNDVPGLDPVDSSLVFTEQKDNIAQGSFSSGVSTATRIYGIVQPNAFGVSALRHTLSPSLGFTYSKRVYGRNLGPKQMVASLGVGNIVEMKTMPDQTDTASQGKKIQLLNLNGGISYNFSADSLNFSEIGVNFRTDIANVVSFSGGTSFNLYKFDESIGRPVNKFLISEEGRLARMTGFNVTVSTSLSGEKSKKAAPQTGAQLVRSETEQSDSLDEKGVAVGGYYGLFAEQEPDLSIPWSLQLSWDFSEGKVPGNRFRRSSLRGDLSFNLTEHWKITASGSYDILNNEIIAPNVSVYRDLHCWEMNFNWVPIGTYRGFRLEIRVKAPQLHDVKVTKQRSARNIY